MAVNRNTRLGRRYPSLDPYQKLLPKLALQRRQLLTEGRLSDMEYLGGLRQATDIHNFHKILKSPQIHDCLSPPYSITQESRHCRNTIYILFAPLFSASATDLSRNVTQHNNTRIV